MLESVAEDDLLFNPVYKGSMVTDAMFALSEFTENWDYLGKQLIFEEDTLPWLKGEDTETMARKLQIGCNNDAQMQPGKGIMGVRLDGVSNAKLSNIEIYNMIQETDLGSTLCGEYTGFEPNSAAFVGGHITQSSPMQVGFSGNMVQGISLNAADGVLMDSIYIKGLNSHSGDAIALSVWPSVSAVLTGNVLIDEITAGSQMEEQKGVLSWESRPNRAPMACGILSTEKFYSKDTATTYMSSVEVNKDQRAD